MKKILLLLVTSLFVVPNFVAALWWPDPVVFLTATPSSVSPGGYVTLSYSSFFGKNCIATGAWSGAKSNSGTEVISNLKTSETYTLTCGSYFSTGVTSKSVTVDVAIQTTAIPCGQEKIREILEPATTATTTVKVNCRLNLNATDRITKQIVIEGAGSNGTVINCNGATLAPSYRNEAINVASVNISKPTAEFPAGRWSAPYDVKVTRCNLVGGITVQGIKAPNGPGVFQDSSRLVNHTLRAQDNAPSKISFSSMNIKANGHTALYVHPGATHVSLTNSRISGNTNNSAIYLDTETSDNIIQNNTFDVDTSHPGITVKTPSVGISGLFCGIGTFHQECIGDNSWHCSWRGCYYSVKVCAQVPDVPYICEKRIPPVVTYTLKYPYQREVIAIDGSANNKIIGNNFNDSSSGGIYIYRNCGEGGVIRHQTPQHNQIINNTFNFGKTTDKPAIWVSSRDGGSPYCDADKGYSLGSSADDTDHADKTVIMGNLITGVTSARLYKIGGSSLSNIDKKAVEELKNAIVAVTGAVLLILANPIAAPLTSLTAPVALLTAPLAVPLGGIAFLFSGFLLPGGTLPAEFLYDRYAVTTRTGSVIAPSVIHQNQRYASCYFEKDGKTYNNGDIKVISGVSITCNDGVWSSPITGALNPIKDLSGRYVLSGWACLKNVPKSIDINLYVVESSGVKRLLNSVSANVTTTVSINDQCGTTGVPHTFTYRITPTEFNTIKSTQNTIKTIFAEGVSGVSGIDNVFLPGSGLVIPVDNPFTNGVIGTLNPVKDSGGQYNINGWACLKEATTSVNVHLYLGEDFSNGGVLFKSIRANSTSTPAVDLLCESTGVPHAFSYKLTPTEFELNKGKKVYAHGVSGIQGIANDVLNGSGLAISNNLPSTSGVVGSVNNIQDLDGVYVLKGWACLLYSPDPVNIRVFFGGPSGTGIPIKLFKADATSSLAIDSQCGTVGVPHAFSYQLSSSDFDNNKGKTVYVYGLSGVSGVSNTMLNKTDITVPVTPPITSGNNLALSVTLNTDYQSKVVYPGVGIKLGSFIIRNPNKTGSVSVPAIQVGIVNKINSLPLVNIVNLNLVASGTPLSTSTSNIQSANKISTNFILGPGESKIIDIFSDINQGASGVIQTTLFPLATNLVSGENVSPRFISSGQTMTVSVTQKTLKQDLPHVVK